MPHRTLRDSNPRGDLVELVEMHQSALILYATRILGEREQARDVVQETFLKYLEKPLRFGEPRQWASWLFRVTHNRCIDLLKRDSRRRNLNLLLPEHQPQALASDDLASAEQRAMIDGLLDRLKPSHRAVLVLFFQEGKSYKEISEISKLSMSNVGMILHRSLKRLRDAAREEQQDL